MEPEWFRVSVSLRRFFSDERARCVMAAARGRSAGWLLRRVRRTFRLPPGRLALLAGACLLPPAEPLALLRDEDACDLEVIPASFSVCDVSAPGAAESDELREDQPDGALCGGDATPSPCPAPALAELEESKRRALQLLDEAVPARRRRVRVRRRRPPPLRTPDPEVEEEGEVMRGEGEGARRARLVHALPASEGDPPCAPRDISTLIQQPVL